MKYTEDHEWLRAEGDIVVVELLNETLSNGRLNKQLIYEWINEPVLEGSLGKILGGLTGLTVGKRIGKILVKVLGIEKGILFDMLTSRTFAIRLGIAIGKAKSKS